MEKRRRRTRTRTRRRRGREDSVKKKGWKSHHGAAEKTCHGTYESALALLFLPPYIIFFL